MHALSEGVKVVRHSSSVAAGTTDVEPSNGVDTQGFAGVMFVIAFGAIVAGAVTSIKAQQSTEVDGSSDTFADIAGTAQTVADDDDEKVFIIDIRNPAERYVRAVVDRGTQNAEVDSITAFLYGADELPTTHDATTVGGSELHVSPSEGTA